MSLKVNMGGSSVGVANGPDGMLDLGSDVRVYRTPSGTRQGVMHFTIVDLLSDMYPQCSCEGYTFRGKCKHADYAHKVWQEEIARSHQLGTPVPVTNVLPVGSVEDKDPEGAFEGLPEE